MSFLTYILLLFAVALGIGLFLLWFLGQNKGRAIEAKSSGSEQPSQPALKASITAVNKKLDLMHERLYALEKSQKPAKKAK